MRLLAAALVVALLSSANAEAHEVKVGVAGPMTGGLAAFGEQIQHGITLAVEDINRQGGLLKHPLSILSADDACDPKQARTVANKMATEKVAVVFGHWCAGPSMAASGVYGEEGILQIDVGGLLDKFTQQGFPNLFRVSTNSTNFARAIGNYTSEQNPKANVAIIADQPAVTKELTQALQTYFATSSNKVVAVEDIRGGDKDFSSIIDRLKTLNPQVVICSCYTIEAGLLARQMSEKNLNVYYYGWDTLNSPDFLKIIGAADTHKMVSIDYARAPDSKLFADVASALQQRQWPVETTTILTYAAFQIFAEAVKMAQSFDATKVAAAMHSKTFTTIIGDVAFDDKGERIQPAFATYQWIDGKLKMTGKISNH